MMIGHHCHSWLDGGGWIGGVNVGVASVGAGSILGVGCCLSSGLIFVSKKETTTVL